MKNRNTNRYSNQDQHKIPQVYLKSFGYKDVNNQWRVSVMKNGGSYTQQKSIKSFTTKTNLFDLNSPDPTVQRIFENELNCKLDDNYRNIIGALNAKGHLTDQYYSYLLQIVANLIIRSDYWRDAISSVLSSPNRTKFLKFVTGHHCKNEEEYNHIDQQPFFRQLMAGDPDRIINYVLLYFMDHLMLRLYDYELVIIQSQDEKPWFTSTNPVVVHNEIKDFEMFGRDSEFYLPLSPKFLAYLHYNGSKDKTNPLRGLQTNQIHHATNDQNVSIQNIILANPAEYIIVAGQFDYRRE